MSGFRRSVSSQCSTRRRARAGLLTPSAAPVVVLGKGSLAFSARTVACGVTQPSPSVRSRLVNVKALAVRFMFFGRLREVDLPLAVVEIVPVRRLHRSQRA